MCLKEGVSIEKDISKSYKQVKLETEGRKSDAKKLEKLQKDLDKIQELKDIVMIKHNDFLELFSNINFRSVWGRTEYSILLDKINRYNFNFYYVMLINNKSDYRYLDSNGKLCSRGYMHITGTKKEMEDFISKVDIKTKNAYKYIEILNINIYGLKTIDKINSSNKADLLGQIYNAISSDFKSIDERRKTNSIYNKMFNIFVNKNGINVNTSISNNTVRVVLVEMTSGTFNIVGENKEGISLTNNVKEVKFYLPNNLCKIQDDDALNTLIMENKNDIKI